MELRQLPDGTWQEVVPEYCTAGHRLDTVLVGTMQCQCLGQAEAHRTWLCRCGVTNYDPPHDPAKARPDRPYG